VEEEGGYEEDDGEVGGGCQEGRENAAGEFGCKRVRKRELSEIKDVGYGER